MLHRRTPLAAGGCATRLAIRAVRVDAAPRAPSAAASSARAWRRCGRRPASPMLDTPICPSRRSTRSVVYLETAPRGAFEQNEPARAVHGSARRDVRAARAGDHHRHDGRFPEQRSHLPQRVLAVEDRERSIWAATRSAVRKRSASIEPGIVRVFCDIHSHMNAFILVFSHPFFAMTDAEGRYRIDNVPPGAYNVIAWNEGVASEPTQRHGARRRRRPNWTSRCDEPARPRCAAASFSPAALLAVLSIVVAIYLVSAGHPRGRKRRCSARSSRPARSSTSCAPRGRELHHDGAADCRRARS